ncbi:hypothetical protein ACL6C3_21020 [Capilliphycus salinus ALCB114379]|uniref:hypothetical protein n=1 Tax=Capilliphycus salinus TaxID=2768948 RepID=UPI0039A6CEB7
MEVILVYLILALVLIWTENESSPSSQRDDRGFEKSDSKKYPSQVTSYQEKPQPEYVRYSEVEDFEINRSRNSKSSQKF